MVTDFKKFSSRVIGGRRIGRTIDFPTANLELPLDFCGRFGVYFARVTIDSTIYFSLVSVGYRPTIAANSEANVECYVLDYSGDLYGKELLVEPLEFIRSERKFGSLQELRSQIVRDEALARILIERYCGVV